MNAAKLTMPNTKPYYIKNENIAIFSLHASSSDSQLNCTREPEFSLDQFDATRDKQ